MMATSLRFSCVYMPVIDKQRQIACPPSTIPSVIGILVNLCRRYRIKLLPEDTTDGESLQERQKRVLRNTSRITLTPLNLRLAFERR